MCSYTVTADYSSIHKIKSLEQATERDLSLLIKTYPIIDNHAHNLLREEHALGSLDHPFESIVSEAQGHALLDHGPTSLAYIRGIKQLAELFNCPPTLEDVKAARRNWVNRDYEGLIQKCLEGTHAIMMDDGLAPEVIHPGRWHRKFVPRVSRIARIEAIAAELLEHLAISAGFMKPGLDGDWEKDQSEAFLSRFNTMFRSQIRTLAQDPHVRGFKSVVCYRSGLDIGLDTRDVFRPHQPLADSSLLAAFHNFIQNAVKSNNYRVQQKEVNDFLVLAVCDVLDKLIDTDGENLPFQFHTGLGDSDIDLIKSNPAYMQPLIAAFPNVDFVLLHSSYPYTRQAGYLATCYANAWLDIGEVFPMLSKNGQEAMLRQALELTPVSKILWSTDGHFFPETYYLANRQFRSVLETVLLDYVAAKDVTVAKAIEIAANIMFWNSNILYKLDEERHYPQLLKACGRLTSGSVRTISNGDARRASVSSRAMTAVPSRSAGGQPYPLQSPRSVASMSLGTTANSASDPSLAKFEEFLILNPHVKYIWIHMVDYTGTVRQRMIPVAQFRKHITTNSYPGMTSALPRLLQNEWPAEGCSATGQFRFMFDTTSLSLNKVINSPSATVQTWWMQDDPSDISTEHANSCPRWALRKQLTILKEEYDIDMLMGFEVEIIFMKPVMTDDNTNFQRFDLLHLCHSWSNMTHQQLDMLPIVEEIVDTLAELDIHVPQFHAEAAPGQWEFPLPAYEPLRAIDTLYKARDVIRLVARKHNLKATLYPRPYPFTCGSASHTHFSISTPTPSPTFTSTSDSFLAGILTHLPSILAFTLPLEESYARVAPGIWAGGEYIAWGTQNRETPIRKCGPSHWELKPVDGIGNMYLSMAALVACGLSGVQNQTELTLRDCPVDASSVSAEVRRDEYGITEKLPKTLGESLARLDADEVIREKLGGGVVDDYVAVKKAEIKLLGGMGEEKRRVWLMSRY